MFLSKIIIDRYKSILLKQTITPNKGVSIFIGKNNSGKSTILDALSRFFRPLQDPKRFIDPEARVEIELALSDKDRTALAKNGQANAPERLKLVLRGEEFFIKTEDETKPISRELSQFVLNRTIRIGAIRDLDFIKMKKIFEEFKSGWPKAFKLFSSKFNIFFPEIKTPSKLFQKKNDWFETTVKEFGQARNIERLGLGFRNLFILLLYYFHPRYDIILIDEPEIHLHPQMIKRLHDLFFENIAEKQVFITTHSPLFVQPESLCCVYRTVQDKDRGTHFHYLTHNYVNASRLEQELNADNCEMFFADRVLLVEGVSDRIFMRRLLYTYYPNTSLDIKVIPVHGKENMDTYAELLKAFHIRYVVMLDKDAFFNTNINIIASVKKSDNFDQEQQRLHDAHVFILPHGALEHHYPKRLIQKDLSKPLLALRVATGITKKDFDEEGLKYIKEILNALIN
ncbi:MAG: AAA family ATPase [Patescibacteria group bacterium]|jgi:predicted ATP-dependent endonuclease of OLD family